MTQESLIDNFNYIDGNLFWKFSGKGHKEGAKLGCITHNGKYLKCILFRKNDLVHRVIFLYHHGYLPEFIDHINGDGLDNRIENLRESTRSQNQCNRSSSYGSSKYKGVVFFKPTGRWKSSICFNNITKHLGYFKYERSAALRYLLEAQKLHGEFLNTTKYV